MTVKNTKKRSIVTTAVSPVLLAAVLFFLQACAGEPPTIPEEPSSPPKPPLVFQAGHADPISAASPLGGGSHLLSASAGTIKLWHSDGRLLRSLEASASFAPLSDRRRFAWLPADRRSIMVSELRETPPRLIFESAESLETLAAGPAGLLLTGPGEREAGTLVLLDDRSGELRARIGRKGGLFPLSQPVFSPDGAILLFSSRASLPEDRGRDPLLLYRLSASGPAAGTDAPAEPSALYPRFAGEDDTVAAVHFLAPDILLLLGSRGTAAAFRLSPEGALEPLWELEETPVRSAAVETGGTRLALSLENGSAVLYRFPDSSAVSRLEKPRLYRTIREASAPLLFPEEGGYLYFADGSEGSGGVDRLTAYDDEEGRALFTFPGPADPILAVDVDEEEERIRVLRPDRVDLLDYAGILRDRLPPPEADSRLPASAAGLLVEASPEGILKIRRTVASDAADPSDSSGSAEVFFAARDGEWISWDINGNYAGSRDAGALLGAAGDGGLHYIGQAASHFNAPDRLLELMQAGTPEEIGYYRKLLRDRDRELDRDPNQNIPLEELYPPRVEISASSSRRITDMKQAMTISFDIQAGAFPVRNYQIRVNGVPLYPRPGKPVATMQVEEEIILYETLNRVEVSCTDSRNVRSNSPFRYGYVKKAKAGDAYYVGFGVSDYDDDSLDLSYAAKDVSDLLIYFENVVFERSFAVTHKAYTDGEVGPDAFTEANRFLRNATGDDTVVIFAAGHVLHAESESGAGFYLLPSSAELADIPATSIPFSELERIFDGVPARRRLLLLDTDRASLPADRDRAIHHEPGCSSGAIIYSSTGGSGEALESGDLKNGLFAESLLQVLVDKRSDRNRNNYIDRRELTGAVTRRVVELSSGRQQPALLRDNPLSPIFLPIVTDFGVDIGSLLQASDASADPPEGSSSW